MVEIQLLFLLGLADWVCQAIFVLSAKSEVKPLRSVPSLKGARAIVSQLDLAVTRVDYRIEVYIERLREHRRLHWQATLLWLDVSSSVVLLHDV